jgi:adenine-specific DNA-methyltransferase
VPPRSRKPAGPTPVGSFTHDAKRINVPTADAAEVYDYQPEIAQVRYARDPTLDPQLVWRGKDEQDSRDLVADAPPIYIQEKIDPRVLVENLRRTAKAGEAEPELTLFETFDELSELDLVDFYRHEANWSNRMILGDSLQVMASLAERESLRGQVQMIYIDPPYGIKFGSNWQASARKRDVKDGKLEDAAREAEQIKAFRDTWELGIHSYLSYLRDRLVAARDLLTESGSCFVQIGDANVHLVRSLMDEVFGSSNFLTLIPFAKTGIQSTDWLGSVTDFILWYGKDASAAKARPLQIPKDRGGTGSGQYSWVDLPDGARRRITSLENEDLSLLPAGHRFFIPDNLTSADVTASGTFRYTFNGATFSPAGGHWKTHRSGLDRLAAAGRLIVQGKTLRYVRYFDDYPIKPLSNLWADTGARGWFEDNTYVVQTGSRVVQRCVLMCTDPGDLVLDPTCGSGTTAYVAEQWGRRWITIDTSRVALALARQRLMGARYPYYFVADSPEGRAKEQEVTGKPLPPAETKGDLRQGFVYERVQHITLKSIANNPDIKEGMSREEIDAAIKRHADFEVLYDKPYEDKRKVRVTGPFTVESLSPHRSLTFDPLDAVDTGTRETISEQLAEEAAEGASFEQSILENLRKAGIQNGQRDERITFESLDVFPGVYLQAVGDTDNGRVAVAIGPQYGTVSAQFIKEAAKEAVKVDGVDLLAVLGFAFDAQAGEVAERKIGRLTVLITKMNVDLLMGEDLKKTGAGNLFTVFGEPDIEVRRTGDEQVVVEIKGVDVFDPTTGDVRSHDTGQIALWMIDTNYNEESFFVRHCYFTGGNDPYKRLKVALKADIDAEAWETLYRTESRSFDAPETSKIAVKVINDYGDEVMKVFEV